jgi:hypothetical protein
MGRTIDQNRFRLYNNLMLEEKDLQAIKTLLKENNQDLKDEIIAEMGEVFSESFSAVEAKIDNLDNELAKRPTKDEMFSWADRRITDLEIGKERHDYMHIDELDKLPAPQEINRVLIERGFKQRLA